MLKDTIAIVGKSIRKLLERPCTMGKSETITAARSPTSLENMILPIP